jgi:arylsulfatase A-like enzyme
LQPPDTAVLFTVDHGGHLGQHRLYQRMEMYEPAARIPLIVSVPGAETRQFDAPVSHLDVMPTLHELLGLDVPGGFDGVSLARSVLEGAPPERPVLSQFSGGPDAGFLRRAVITRCYRYIFAPNEWRELYDLDKDPLEMENLADEPAFADTEAELHDVCGRGDRHTETGFWIDCQ